MVQIIKTISLSKQENDFILERNISPTRIIRNFIQERMDTHPQGSAKIKELNQKVERLAEIIKEYVDFIEKRGLIDEFISQKNKK